MFEYILLNRNRRGNVLAAGTTKGTIVLWCFDTRTVVRDFRNNDSEERRRRKEHVFLHQSPALEEEEEEEEEVSFPIRCLCWRRDNRKIAAGDANGHVLIWDVLTGDLETRMTDIGTLNNIEFTKDFKALLFSPAGFKAPMFRAISKRSGTMWPDTVVPLPEGSVDEADVHGCPAILTRSGNFCVYATTGGGLCVARLKEDGEGAQMRRGWKLVQTIELVAKDAKMVKRLELSRDGKTLLVVSFSKCIVAFDVVGDVEDKKRNKEKEVLKNDDNNNDDTSLLETVLKNRRQFENEHSQSSWESACVAFDNKFVYAASSTASHEVHCWNLKTLELTRVLEGPNEAKGLIRSCYHPKRHLMIGVGANGIMYVWAKVYEESWTAFQPDFQELKENREYIEREDEFDIKDEEENIDGTRKEKKPNVTYLDDASSLTFADLKLWDTDLSAYWTDADEDVMHDLPVEVIVDYELQAKMTEKKKKWERKQALKAEKKKKEAEEKETEKNGGKGKEREDDVDENTKKQKMDDAKNEGTDDAAKMEEDNINDDEKEKDR
jgi:COMPASS component SWD1